MSRLNLYPGLFQLEEVTFDPASVAANTTAEQDITVPGITTDCILVAWEPPAMGVAVAASGARIKSNGIVAVSFTNATAGALNPTGTAWKFLFALKS